MFQRQEDQRCQEQRLWHRMQLYYFYVSQKPGNEEIWESMSPRIGAENLRKILTKFPDISEQDWRFEISLNIAVNTSINQT